MGNLEQSVKRKIRLAKIQKAILYTIIAVGVLSSPFAATKILKELRRGGWKETKRNPHYTINNSIKHLLQSNLIYFEETPKGKFIRLTKEGESYLRLYTEFGHQLSKPKKWDGKWRIVMIFAKKGKLFGKSCAIRSAKLVSSISNTAFGFILMIARISLLCSRWISRWEKISSISSPIK